MIHEPLWQAHAMPPIPAAAPPDHVDVAIIGAGITGLTAAALLKLSGKRVAVFEKDTVGSGETGHTSAHLTYVTDTRLGTLIKRFDEDTARLAWEAGAVAINLIEGIVTEHRIDCDFHRVPGFVCNPVMEEEEEGSTALAAEAALARSLGFTAAFHALGPIRGRPAVSYADQAIIHPRKYLAGLARLVHGDGSCVCEHAEVTEISDEPLTLTVGGTSVQCDYLVIATHVPLAGVAGTVRATLFQTKLFPHSTYVLGARLPSGLVAPGLYNDTSDPYYYLRVHEDATGAYAIFGGEDHKTGKVENTEACYDRLQATLTTILPEAQVDRRWSGQVIESNDGLPYIGETAARQFVGTGFAGNGLTFGTVSGMMAHDAALNLANPWKKIFNPSRQDVAGVVSSVREGIDYPLHYIADRLRTDRKTLPESIEPGQGKVIVVEGRRVACSRTDNGELIVLEAECTHMGCVVRWNVGEQTWDCPCHGSRFAPDGAVIGGPAETPLQRVEYLVPDAT
ncbi:MAG: FAD-dependent oxidoreductase [Cytophagaceae bacterium]|nr:FAD-dependent oxidoreductase [Gemmatimonadaceae bacterium]